MLRSRSLRRGLIPIGLLLIALALLQRWSYRNSVQHLEGQPSSQYAVVLAQPSSTVAMALQRLGQIWLGLTTLSAFAQSDTAGASATSSAASTQFTVPASADEGATLLANIEDPNAPVAQDLCPGYTASQVSESVTGLTAHLTLAGQACNVYGTDVSDLDLTVEYQTDQRLHVVIQPSYTSAENASWYILPSDLVNSAEQEDGSAESSDLAFSWANDPDSGFGFNVSLKSSGEVLFSTTGNKLVFENQFIEFVTSQHDNYNLYGLGEVIHGLRLGNNFTRTIYAADVGDPIDTNLYGSHPFYLQTRYYQSGQDGLSNIVTEELDVDSATGNYTSYTNGVFLRNAHGQEVLLNANNITWRTIGGSLDFYFFSGPTQPEVTQQYLDVVGRPTMQQYWGFGYHQCRWVSDAMSSFGHEVDAIGYGLDPRSPLAAL